MLKDNIVISILRVETVRTNGRVSEPQMRTEPSLRKVQCSFITWFYPR